MGDLEGTAGIPDTDDCDSDHSQKEKERHGVIRWLWTHPTVVRQIQHVGGFKTYGQAAVWANKRRNQGVIRYVGSIRPDENGRPLDVYCNGWRPKQDHLRHEVQGTAFCLLPWGNVSFRRGYEVDAKRRPDIEMGEDFSVEIDCGSMDKNKVLARWRKWKGYDGRLLIVTISNPRHGIDSAERLKKLMSWSESIADIAEFTTLERLQNEGPYQRVWTDLEGTESRLTNPFKNPEVNCEQS